MTWTLDIPVEIPSANQLMRGRTARARRGRYKRLREAFAWAVRAEAGGIPAATTPRSVRVTRWLGYRQRAYDHDNLVAACKPLIDELVAHGLLLDDSPRWAEIVYAQVRGWGVGCRVEVTE